jgi:hypothetical protein
MARVIDLDLAAFNLVIFGSNNILGHDHFIGFAGGIDYVLVIRNSMYWRHSPPFHYGDGHCPNLLQVGPSIQATNGCPSY